MLITFEETLLFRDFAVHETQLCIEPQNHEIEVFLQKL